MENLSPYEPSKETSVFDEFDFQSQNHQKHIRQARITIFVVAGIQLVFGMMSAFRFGGITGWLVFGITALIALIFFMLGIWASKKPFSAILIALIIYSILLITDLTMQPATIVKGIFVKIVIIIFLWRGLRKARDAERWASAFRK